MFKFKNSFFVTSCILLVIGELHSACHGGILNNRVDNPEECYLTQQLKDEIRSYETVANRIIQEIVNGKFKGHTWEFLARFIDTFGPRLSGTQTLEDSIDYMVELSKNHSLKSVITEPVQVPAWTRGPASLSIEAPVKRDLAVLTLGGSVGGSVRALAVVVKSFEELAKISDAEIRGKIVVFNPDWVSYGDTVTYRSKGASIAAKRGASAALVRAITPKSMRTLHTGSQSYEDDAKKIPVASITPEDAEFLHRLYKEGEHVSLNLQIVASQTQKESRNTIVSLNGTDPKARRPIVVVSGHIDSWDVGDGAMDDGGGVMVSFTALHFLKELNLIPRRTIRAIFWTAEEQGLIGAQAYVNAHTREEDDLNFVMESDMGTFRPHGLDFTGSHDAGCIIQEVLKLLKPINATQFKTPHDGGPDIGVWTQKGIPGSSLLNANEEYFWYHHSPGDSMVVEDPHNLDLCAAVWTVVSYVIADLKDPLPRI